MAPEALTSVNFILPLRLRIFFPSYVHSRRRYLSTTNTCILIPITISKILTKHRQVALISSAAELG